MKKRKILFTAVSSILLAAPLSAEIYEYTDSLNSEKWEYRDVLQRRAEKNNTEDVFESDIVKMVEQENSEAESTRLQNIEEKENKAVRNKTGAFLNSRTKTFEANEKRRQKLREKREAAKKRREEKAAKKKEELEKKALLEQKNKEKETKESEEASLKELKDDNNIAEISKKSTDKKNTDIGKKNNKTEQKKTNVKKTK